MKRLGNPPSRALFDSNQTDSWFQTVTERCNVFSGPSDPLATEVPENQWIVYRNTTSGEVRIWTNIAGVLKKSAAFT